MAATALHRQYHSQNGEDIIAWHALRHTPGPCYFVEVGMIDGVRFSNTYHLEQQGWRGLCVEAHPGFIDLVRRNRPDSTVIHAAAVERSGDAIAFYADPRGDLSSLTPRDPGQMRRRFGEDFRGYQRVNVPARTLDDMLEAADAPSGFELLSIDIEGAELAALRGLNFDRWRPRVILAESEGTQAQQELNQFMQERGYRLARRVGINTFYARTARDAWALRLVRVTDSVVHDPNPVDEGAVAIVRKPHAYEKPRQYLTRLLRSLARAA